MNRKRSKLDIEEAERHRIAKDLHDSVGQQLTAIKLYLGTLKTISKKNDQSKCEALITKSISAVDEATADLSNICYNLMPGTLIALGLIKGVNELAYKINAAKGIKVYVDISPEFPAVDKTLSLDLFRIIQEFINNSIKHSQATQVDVFMKYNKRGKNLSMLLKDNGKGFDVRDKINSGMGLINARLRVGIHKGTILINSSINKGTNYEIDIPVKNKFAS